MAKSGICMSAVALFAMGLFVIPIAYSDDLTPIPEDKAQVASWFEQNVAPLSARKGTIDPILEAAEADVRVINLKSDGSGDFKSINAAIESIPMENKQRVILSLGSGVYKEKIKIERAKPFITFQGDAKDMPVIDFHGTAAEYGTHDSATVIVLSNYFNAVNIQFVNSAPRPTTGVGQQAVAVRIGGDKASFYNCKFIGFQDTLCDSTGRHFYKDCYIEGTVDFIFGDGKSIYLNTELHVISGDSMAMITAQAGETKDEDEGFSMVHCTITGTGRTATLGRAWLTFPKVTFSFTEMSDAITEEGWSNNRDERNNATVIFGEYKNTGPGSNPEGRAKFAKQLTQEEVKTFISLGYIAGSSWLLPPTAAVPVPTIPSVAPKNSAPAPSPTIPSVAPKYTAPAASPTIPSVAPKYTAPAASPTVAVATKDIFAASPTVAVATKDTPAAASPTTI